MNDLFITAWILTAFLFGFGVLFLWLTKEIEPANRQKNVIDKVVNLKVALLCLGLGYIVLAHFTAYSGIVIGLETGTTPECENLLNETTITINTTSYSYYNSCAGTNTKLALNGIILGYNALMLLDLFFIFIGLTFLMFRGFTKW